MAGRPSGGGGRRVWPRWPWRYVALGVGLAVIALGVALWRVPVLELRAVESKKPPLYIIVDKNGEFAVTWLTKATFRGLPDDPHSRLYQVLRDGTINAAAATPEEGTPQLEGNSLRMPAGEGRDYLVVAAGGQVALSSFAPDGPVVLHARRFPVLVRWWWTWGHTM